MRRTLLVVVPVDLSLLESNLDCWTVVHRNGYNYVELYIRSFHGCLSSKTDSIDSFRINILEYFKHQVSTLKIKAELKALYLFYLFCFTSGYFELLGSSLTN